MNSLLRRLPAGAPTVLALVLSQLAPPLAGQTRNPSPDVSDEQVELPPFIINAETDSGYAPTETLSGTRLRTQTKNVASAMTIFTVEMLRDIGALNFYDVVDFLPSTFAYGSNEGDATGNGLRTGSPFYVRGYRSDSLTTNFFTASFPIDSYNTGRMTFTRGPNSILFGIGNPGGTIDVTNNMADLRKNSYKLDLRVDSYDSFRTAGDANIVLVPKKLGLRLDVLHDVRGSNIKPSENRRDSIFGTVTYKPSRNTAVYLNVESNHQRTQIPRPYEFYDWYNTWAAAGKPIKAVAKNTAGNPGWEFQSGSGYPVVIPGIGVMNWASMAFGGRPTVRGSRESKNSYGVGSPNQIVPLDTNVVGNGDRMNLDNENYTVIFQQRLAEGLYLEIAGKHDHSYRKNLETDGNVVALQVDPNAQLPDGTPNPNVGLPYVEIRPTRQQIATDVNQLRATLSYEKDLTRIKLFNRGLGQFSFGGLYNNETSHQFLEQYAETNLTPLANADLSNSVNTVRRRQYFLPGQPNYYASNFDAISGNGIQTGWELASSTPRNNFTRVVSYSLAGQALLLDDLLALTGGLRRDEQLVTSVNYVKDARGLWPNAHGGTGAPAARGIGRPYLCGLVLNAHKNFSLFINKATNNRSFNQSNRTIDGALITTLAGRGTSYGLKFFLLKDAQGMDRLSGSFEYFETAQTNILDSTLRGKKAAWINSIWEVLDPAKRPDLLGSWTDMKNQKTRGVEFQWVANPAKNLRLFGNVSRNISVLETHGAATFAYLAANYPVWQARASTLLTSSTTDGTTVGDLIPKIQAEADDDKRVIGIKQTKVPEWQTNLVARYQFPSSSALKGFAIGTAHRWRTAPVIGFYRTVTANTPLGILDSNRPIKGTSSANVDAWLEYNRPFTFGGKKARCTTQLRVQNVVDDRTLLPWQADVDNTGVVYIQQRKPPGERLFSLSSTFDF